MMCSWQCQFQGVTLSGLIIACSEAIFAYTYAHIFLMIFAVILHLRTAAIWGWTRMSLIIVALANCVRPKHRYYELLVLNAIAVVGVGPHSHLRHGFILSGIETYVSSFIVISYKQHYEFVKQTSDALTTSDILNDPCLDVTSPVPSILPCSAVVSESKIYLDYAEVLLIELGVHASLYDFNSNSLLPFRDLH